MPRTQANVAGPSQDLATSIGRRLRAARVRAGLTQQQLAAGRYTKAYVSALEHGTAKPSMVALTFLAEQLRVSPATLLGDDSPTWTRLEADLQLAAGNWQAAADAYEMLLSVKAEDAGRAELLRGLSEALCRLDRPADAIPVASQAVELFSATGSEADTALASYWLSFALYLRENESEARDILRGILDRIRSGLVADPDLKVRVLVALSMVESRAGESAKAVTYLEEARGAATDLDDRRRAAFLYSIAATSRENGDIEGAIRAGTQSLALYRAAGAAYEEASIENDLALAYLALGNAARAGDLARRAREAFEKLDDERWLAHVYETEAQIALAQGSLDAALGLCGEAITRAQATQNQKALMSALVTRAKTQSALGDYPSANDSFRDAAELARDHGSAGRRREVLGEWASYLAERGDHAGAYRLAHEALNPPS